MILSLSKNLQRNNNHSPIDHPFSSKMDPNLKSQFFHCKRWIKRYKGCLSLTQYYMKYWKEQRDDPARLKKHKKHCSQPYHAHCGNSVMEGGYLAGVRERDCYTQNEIDQIVKYYQALL